MFPVGIVAKSRKPYTRVYAAGTGMLDIPDGRTTATVYMLARGQNAWYYEGYGTNVAGPGAAMLSGAKIFVSPGLQLRYYNANSSFNQVSIDEPASPTPFGLNNGTLYGYGTSKTWILNPGVIYQGGGGSQTQYGMAGGGGAAGTAGNGGNGRVPNSGENVTTADPSLIQGAPGPGLSFTDSVSGITYAPGKGNNLYGGGGAVTGSYEQGRTGFIAIVWD